MRIKVAFEIGHTAHAKSKASPEGFTHDWELFVRGTDGANISRFVDKIVFNLHESFIKPCRVYKDPPYVLKESGYASFNLQIDIYLKASQRDETKKFTVTYDLDISKTTIQKYPFLIPNPTPEFREKLLAGGGIPINDGHPDDRTYSQQPDSTTAKSRPQSSSSGVIGSGKKYKNKTDEMRPTSTFENLFGSPIFNSKNSPDPKLNNITSGNSGSSSCKVPITSSGSSKSSSQKSSKDRTSEKSSKEKRDKKDKSSSSTPKQGSKESSSKSSKSDDKHDRREEKRKEKSTTKDRERGKEKSKRPPSPKPASRSPKPRPKSPSRANSSNSNRHDSITLKYDEKSSNSNKKSKKEKRDKSKERERSSSDKSKENKHQMQKTQINKQKSDNKSTSKSTEKLNGSSKRVENEKKERDKSSKYSRASDVKQKSTTEVAQVKVVTPIDSKKSHDKDERKHKHKKKDKNKEKDRKKSKSKVTSDESQLSTTSLSNRKHSQMPITQTNRQSNAKSNAIAPLPPPPLPPPTKPTKPTPPPTLLPPPPPQTNHISEKLSNNFNNYDRTSPKPDKVSSSNDTNQTRNHQNDSIPKVVTPRANKIDSSKKQSSEKKSSSKKSKEPKSNQTSSSKEDKKKNRNTKNDKQKQNDSGASSSVKRKTQSPIVKDEPPAKLFKRDNDKIPKIKDDLLHETNKMLPARTPPVVSHLSPSAQKLYRQSPDSSKQAILKRSAESNQTTKMSMRSPLSSDGEASKSRIKKQQQQQQQQQKLLPPPLPPPPPPPPPPSSNPSETESTDEKQYMAQLRALQHKIMNIKDNHELQQIVEIIIDTGCYEVNNRTFDFDLCALDRKTVQRIQERLG